MREVLLQLASEWFLVQLAKQASALDLRAPKVVPLTCLSATPLPSASEKHLS